MFYLRFRQIGKKMEKSRKKLEIFYHLFSRKSLIINENAQKKS